MSNLITVFPKYQIDSAVRYLAEKINQATRHNNRDVSPVIVSILNAAFMFTADLVRYINTPVHVEFLGISSYRGERRGRCIITNELPVTSIEGRNVIIVDTICDSGETLKTAVEYVRSLHPFSLVTCVLVDKKVRIKEYYPLYIGLKCDDVFLVGYGTDKDGLYRERANICRIQSEEDKRKADANLTNYRTCMWDLVKIYKVCPLCGKIDIRSTKDSKPILTTANGIQQHYNYYCGYCGCKFLVHSERGLGAQYMRRI